MYKTGPHRPPRVPAMDPLTAPTARSVKASSRTEFVAIAGLAGVTVASWVVALRQMAGMDMGVATELGSFPVFVGAWVSMMAAMMLPGAIPSAWRSARDGDGIRAVPPFITAYIAVWAIVGLAVYVVYRPHGTLAAGIFVVAAGVYELTPFKRNARSCCHRGVLSGFHFGLYCLGSSAGLMLAFVALGPMSAGWMVLVAAIVLFQKLVAPIAAIDLPLGLTIAGLGVLVVLAPATVPGVMPPM